MATTEERMKILKMVEEGKISAEDGAKLLAALSSATGNGSAQQTVNMKGGPGARWLRIRVTNAATGQSKVNVNLPIGLVNIGAKIAGKFAPESDALEWNQIIDAVKSGAQGKIIEVVDDEDGERVEIFVE